MALSKKAAAEILGTFWLVFTGCGSAVLAAGFPQTGIGFLGVAFVFGLSLLTVSYAIGNISGCHVNPAVSVGFFVARRLPVAELPLYVISQLVGAILRSAILYVIASGKTGFTTEAGFAANGYNAHSPGRYPVGSCFLMEAVMTFMFLIIILGATDRRAPKGMGPLSPWDYLSP